MKEVDEKICGRCVHFKYEDTEGWGQCVFATSGICHCSDLCTSYPDELFMTEDEKRHYLAVLRKCQRCLVKNVGTPHDMDVKSVSEALDFVIEYAKLY